jgi:hypothetical protein
MRVVPRLGSQQASLVQGSEREGGAGNADGASGKSRGRLSVRIKLNSAAQPAQSQGTPSFPRPCWTFVTPCRLSALAWTTWHPVPEPMYDTALQSWLASETFHVLQALDIPLAPEQD